MGVEVHPLLLPLPASGSWESCLQGHEWERAVLPLISCSTWESQPCTSPGQHNRADPGGRGAGEPFQRVIGKLAPPLICCEVAWMGVVMSMMSFPLSPLTT